MFEALTGSLVVLSVLPLALAGLAVAYVSLRIRDARADPPDPELGVKAAYYTFLTAGIFLALTGLSLSVIDFLGEAFEGQQARQPQPQFNPQFNPQQGRFLPPPQQQQPKPDDPFDRVSQRVAWPLVVSGVLFSLLSLLLIKAGTNDARFPSARRTFVGFRLVVAGLNVMIAVTLVIELLFQKDLPSTRPYSTAIGLLIIWLPTTAIHLFLIKQYAKLPYFVPPKPKKAEPLLLDEDDREDRREEDRPRGRRRPPRRETADDED